VLSQLRTSVSVGFTQRCRDSLQVGTVKATLASYKFGF